MTLPVGKYRKRNAPFWTSVYFGEHCWEWMSEKNALGYGKYQRGFAHRYSAETEYGPAGSLFVCHHCDNPSCVRPSHLYLGTQADNVADRVRRKRSHCYGVTHCPLGHEYNDANTYIHTNGSRNCRECNRIRLRKRNREKLRADERARYHANIEESRRKGREKAAKHRLKQKEQENVSQ